MLPPMLTTQISADEALRAGGPLATRVAFSRPAFGQSVRQMRQRKKRHHSVPQYLLRRFCDASRQVWAYDRIAKKSKNLSPQAVCAENDLYTVADQTGSKSDTVEEFFAEIDRECATFIETITTDRPIIQDRDRAVAIRFMASQFVRAGHIVKGVERAGLHIVRQEAPRMAKELLADALATGTWSVSGLEEISRFKERASELEVENMAANLPWLMGDIEQVLMHGRLDIHILTCPQGRIIISDYPIALIGADDSYSTGGETPGFQNAVEIWCPLSPELAMIATRTKLEPNAVLRPKLSVIKSRNLRIALDSRRWVIEKPGSRMIRRLNIPKPDARFTGNRDSLWPKRSTVSDERPIGTTDLLSG